MKLKTCSFCNKEVPKLWYANPKCCTDFKCRAEYAKVKGKEKTSKTKGSTLSSKGKVSKIQPLSDKMRRKLAEYRKVRDQYLKDNPNCEICGNIPVELHHKKPRAYYLCDVSVFMSVCRRCHNKIENFDGWARENGHKLDHL